VKDWFKALNYQINSSSVVGMGIASRLKFWKVVSVYILYHPPQECFISGKEFEKMADCLDIVLFRS
jgi:hypothetical protein